MLQGRADAAHRDRPRGDSEAKPDILLLQEVPLQAALEETLQPLGNGWKVAVVSQFMHGSFHGFRLGGSGSSNCYAADLPKFNPHGQGFMAATNIKRAGKVSDPAAREMVTFPSSNGCRITSRVVRRNSGNSSRNNTP